MPTIKGPEATDLATKVSGTVVWERPVGGLVGQTLPKLQEIVVRPYWEKDVGLLKEYPSTLVHTAGGPDQEHRIVYIEQELSASSLPSTYRLKVIGVDGRGDRSIATLAGAKQSNLSEVIALAPVGGRAVFLSQTRSAPIENRPYYLGEGTLEIWDIGSGHKLPASLTALDKGLSWFPDGKRLAYVEAVPTASAPKNPPEGEPLGQFAPSSHFPTVHILDTDSGAKRAIRVGTDPVVSSDGLSLLVKSLEGVYRKVDIARGTASVITVPGLHGNAIAFFQGRYVLYQALPTEGAPVVRSPYGSFRAGLQMITLKLTDLETGRFQTVVPIIDSRWSLSFGSTGTPQQ